LTDSLATLVAELKACRLCRDAHRFGQPLPHEPRPILQIAPGARLLIASQAPGTRAHASGVPFTDASGDRLRQWLGLDHETFYDASRVAIVPMGHCFPGLDAKGGDLPPRRECALHWRERMLAGLNDLELVLVIGRYARDWHLPEWKGSGLTETVMAWRQVFSAPRRPKVVPLPHPSWRNNHWLRKHQWFEAEALPVIRAAVSEAVRPRPGSPNSR
jgi:uracil-DNA glycosylase